MESPPPSSVRLLPLIPESGNEGLANLLARLLIEDQSQAEIGASNALIILTGIQAFYDSGGDYLTVERFWEPFVVARQMKKAYGPGAAQKAAEMGAAARATKDERGAVIYERVADMLQHNVNKC